MYKLIGGRYHQKLPAYANGWYGGAKSPPEYAERARDAIALGYRALKFDPFGTAWKTLDAEQSEAVIEMVAAIREAVGPKIGLMVEFHGRLDLTSAADMIRRLERFSPLWCEEPILPESLELLATLKQQVHSPISAGERL